VQGFFENLMNKNKNSDKRVAPDQKKAVGPGAGRGLVIRTEDEP
jgi:hypothetical protein